MKTFHFISHIGMGFMNFIHHYVLEMIIIGFMLLGLFWAIGYFMNALYGYHFELQSCWGGFSAIGGAGTLAAVKYIMDSWKNTPEGEAPTYGRAAQNIIDSYVSHQPAKTEVNLHVDAPRQEAMSDERNK